MIHRAPTDLIPELWPMIEPHAVKAMRWHPFMDEEDLLRQMLIGHGQIFIVTDSQGFLGFAAMEVLSYPRRRVANVLAAGGKRGFLSVLVRELLPQLEKWANEHDADTLCVMGRPGWLKYAREQEGTWTLPVYVSQKQLKRADTYVGRRDTGSDHAGQ